MGYRKSPYWPEAHRKKGRMPRATIARMTSQAQDMTARASLAARIDAALPQTQCGRCGWPDCAAYAAAIARGEADINQCPPGGAEGVRRLAAITGLPARPLNPDNGLEGPRDVALIDEDWCIGCTLCIKACPTDAILGLNKRMHAIIEAHCTGCALCVPACPVDCIAMVNASGALTGWAAWSEPQAHTARTRYAQRQARLRAPQAVGRVNAPPMPASGAPQKDAQQGGLPAEPTHASAAANDTGKNALIAAALARARAQRQSAP